MGHDHAHVNPEDGDRRVAAAVAVNLALTLAQVVGGVLAGSLALIADAIKAEVKALLRDRFGVGHSTLELECGAHACDTPQRYGHA